MEKKKLSLNKKVISKLTNEEQSSVLGGGEAYGSSKQNCTGFLCCAPAASSPEFTCPTRDCPPPD